MIHRFAKDLLTYALPTFLARAIGLLLLPIYTRQLGPTDYGFIEFVAAFAAIILLVLPLEINQAVGRLLPESKDVDRTLKIISTALWFTVVTFSLFGWLMYILRFQLMESLNLPNNYTQFASYISLHLLIVAVVNLLQVQFRFNSQAKASVTVNIAVVLTNLIIVLYFSIFNELGVKQYFLSQILSGCVGVLIGLSILIKQFRFLPLLTEMHTPLLRELLTYSLPIVLSSIGVALSTSVDRLMVGSYIGLTELGHYGVAMRLSAIVGLGFYVISSAMTPIVYKEYEKAETKVLIVKVFKYTIYLSFVLLFFLAFFSKSIVVWLTGNQYIQASEYIFYLTLSAIIGNLYIFFLGMDIAKKTKIMSGINLFTGLVGTTICVTLVPVIGIWGAIAANFLANSCRFAGYVYFSQKIYTIPIRLNWWLLLILGVVLSSLAIH